MKELLDKLTYLLELVVLILILKQVAEQKKGDVIGSAFLFYSIKCDLAK